MEPETSRVVAQPQIDGSRRVLQPELEQHLACLAPGRSRHDNAEGPVGPAEPEDGPTVTEDASAELLASREDLHLELRVVGRHEGINRENQLDISRRRVQQSEHE